MYYNSTMQPNYILFQIKPRSNLPVIFIDFDYTISDFGKLKSDIKSNCAKLGIPENVWNDDYDVAKNELGIYQTEIHIKILSDKFKIDLNKVHKAFFDVYENADDYVYEDVYPFLKFASEKFNIYLFSLGVEIFQFVKRESSKVDKYFTGAINTRNSKYLALPEILKDKEFESISELLFIDDKADYFAKFESEMKNTNILHRYFWINRPNAKYSSILPDKSIEQNVFEVDDMRRLEDLL